ncbi:MAG: HAMP domain-containing sensor histidine kinase [Actinomycetota bacterium]|nr:HAMP domain-containing sensor histidine kinase [Actinomycetota bacterium]
MTATTEPTGTTISSRARRMAVLAAVLSLVVAFAVFYAAWYSFTVRTATQELSRQVRAVASGVEAAGDVSPAEGELDAARRTRDTLFKVEAGLIGAALLVTDGSGTITRTTADQLLPLDSEFPLDLLGEPDDDGVSTGRRIADSGVTYVLVAVPVQTADGDSWVVAASPLSEVVSARAWIAGLLGASLLVALLIAWIAGGLLARRFARPLVRLQTAAESVAGGEWGTTVAEEGDAEVRSLAHSFNRMSDRVAAAYRAQKEFVGDVSHEIRTPITSIRGFSEALLDGTVTDPETTQESLTIIRDESVRLADLARTLLALSDLDAGVVEFAREPVEPARLVAALLARHVDVAKRAGVDLTVVPPDASDLWPCADESRLVQAASVLVDNAISYTPDGGSVRVAMGVSGVAWSLTVDDSGSGVPKESRDKVFGRFSRLDRSRAATSGGHGLGLPICRRIVELMDGTVQVDRSALGGAQFIIALPVARESGADSTRTQHDANVDITRQGDTPL